MRTTSLAPLLVALVAVATGCDVTRTEDGSTNPTGVVGGIEREGMDRGTPPTTRNDGEGGGHEEFPPNLLEVEAAVVPGASSSSVVVLDVVVRSPLKATDYTLQVLSPEIDTHRAGQSPAANEIPISPLVEVTGAAAGGGESGHRLEVPVDLVGAFTFIVSATTDRDERYPESAEAVATTLWAEVDEAGVAPIEDIAEAWTSEESFVSLGVRQESGVNAVVLPNTSQARSGAYSTLRVMHFDPVARGYRPVPNVKVATHNSSAGGLTSYSDENGYASVVCTPNGYPPLHTLGEVRTEGSGKVRVYRDPSWWIPFNETTLAASFADPPCGATQAVYIDSGMAASYIITDRAAREYEQYFGQSRGLVEVFVIKEVKFANAYNPSSDNIKLHAHDVLTSGIFSLATHEYGHAYHYKALGGYDSSKCGEPHSFEEAVNMTCAYVEGFADFARALAGDRFYEDMYPGRSSWGVVSRVSGNTYPVWYETIEDGVVVDDTEVTDGSRVEIAVAATFFDMYDPPGVGPYEAGEEADFDQLQYSGPYLASVLRTCTVNPDELDGIDQALSCIKGRPVPYYSGYFTERAYDERVISATNSSGRPSGWDEPAFDRMWKKNLFRVHPAPPNNTPISASISGPSTANAGSAVTYSANVSNAGGAVSYSWEYKPESDSGGGSGPILGDPAPTLGEWRSGGTASTLTVSMSSTYSHVDVRLTVNDSRSSHMSTKRTYVSGGGGGPLGE